ncbi:hypothetical protein TWF970_008263 [Orbilia oligospora]|uniref:Pre-mRNA-splicing factor n=2 Tax=Orbilia oligospora TaxID=2813651 RepID=A0A7C8V4A4_ORBOL|nr:hypothetical protein TWF970_008263 [Orbilia oligospora]
MSSYAPDLAVVEDGQPTFSDLQGESIYAVTANKHWLKPDIQVRFSPKVVKEIYSALEKEGFPQRDILLLENLQYMERYLWPNYDEDSTDEFVICLVMMAVAKRRGNIPLWGIFEANPSLFTSFFRRVLIMSLSTSLPLTPRTHVLCFIIFAFQSLDKSLVRKECAPLVSIGIWQNIHSEKARELRLSEGPQYKKAWKASEKKRLALTDQRSKARLSFERSWLHSLVLQLVHTIYFNWGDSRIGEARLYAERMVEFLTDLLSQPPTRRYVHALLEDLQIVICIRLSPVYAQQENQLLRDLVALLEHFYYHDDSSAGDPRKATLSVESRYRRNIARLQNAALQMSKGKLTVLGLANYASIGQKDDLSLQISMLDDGELSEIYERLLFRQNYPEGVPRHIDRSFMLCAIVEAFSKRESLVDIVRNSSLLPTEETLANNLLHTERYTWESPVPVPKLNIQYLSIKDFLWRAFFLHRAESFFEIHRDIQDTLRRLKPISRAGSVAFSGNSKMAAQINRLAILEEAPSRVGENLAAHVRAEVLLDLGALSEDTKREWETLRPDDVVFLLSIRAGGDYGHGLSVRTPTGDNAGVYLLRCAEVIQVLGDNKLGSFPTTEKRKLHIRLDRAAYMADKRATENITDIYGSLNILIRRKGIENNFKAVLSSIKCIIENPANFVPGWFEDAFLGCGDPSDACFPRLLPLPNRINLGETITSLEHLQETFPKIPLDFDIPVLNDLGVPFVLTELRSRHSSNDSQTHSSASQYPSYSVSSGADHPPAFVSEGRSLSNMTVKYTAAQVHAILSGTNPGLSMIVGPPGTGKTDVATQIIHNLYLNFPNERTLVIAHSNQSLNQIFQKLEERDIDERHLLRLGHGEDDSQQPSSSMGYSKFGRIESLADLRSKLLEEVDQLSSSLGAPGAHGNSCETASYFYRVWIEPLWEKFNAKIALSPTPATILTEFPFTDYFSGKQHRSLPTESSLEVTMGVAKSCFEHISKIFSQLDDLMPFELLRNGRDKTNYLLCTEARIIAMTSTYAAMKREDIVRQGFRYDNIIMEEAAQISEAETFITLTLQNSPDGKSPIKRVILCGDHLQNSPVIQSSPLRYFANMEQSLFARFVRLGVPLIRLDKQGRARPSIASLYSWRYPGLGNLDYLSRSSEFLKANAGFRHELQFINIDNFRGNGEQEPFPHFIQNLGEAEYSVALFQYMRLLGYPANKISILSSYSGQRALIRDIINHRCAKNPLFGTPAHITTIDKFQGEQNDYIIVSLVRTKRVGYLRDMRRLTVGLSRARLGLYILGRLEIFQTCYELKNAFSRLLQLPTKLELTTGEMWPTERLVTGSVEATVIEGVEHLGKYVFEMTEAKLASLKIQSQ